ncbi:MAG: hypothetical protein KKB91_03175 [Proteobacteria bacterium]|nr:hypothetical protein [Desulfocapsa sp.]MBU3944410.1 hypothetical protein [Pseudomonadota bacterium]MCG2742640.1 hypothetical protein [Desulfobacteraceae bacterium]MBU4028541.1 hypothetical protein [Pseudomonadota bacterium]MBU4042999.1 hypothetical protein [Pseudomonadota bacterium]
MAKLKGQKTRRANPSSLRRTFGYAAVTKDAGQRRPGMAQCVARSMDGKRATEVFGPFGDAIIS